MNTRGSVAYVPQQAWIQNASVQVSLIIVAIVPRINYFYLKNTSLQSERLIIQLQTHFVQQLLQQLY